MLKKTFISSLLIALLVILSCGLAQAGIITLDLKFNPSGDHSYDFNEVNLELTLYEELYGLVSLQVDMSGETDSDPTFHVVKTVSNESGLTWTAYEMILSGTGVSFDYATPPTSNRFLTNDQQPMKLTFYSPDSVPNGDAVTLNFDIRVTQSGLFSFTLTQNPLPEPATICLLGLGVLSLIRRKK